MSQTRTQWISAIFISLTAGYIDGYGLLFFQTFVSFMSGNTTRAGLKTGQSDFSMAVAPLIAITSFFAGSFWGNFIAHSKLRYAHRLVFWCIAGAIAITAVGESTGTLNRYGEIALMSFAMGMTNPAMSRIGGERVNLTFVTGAMSRVGGHLASAIRRAPLPNPQGPEDSHLLRALIDGSIYCGFLAGAILSGMAGSNSRVWGLWPACAVLVILGFWTGESESKTPG